VFSTATPTISTRADGSTINRLADWKKLEHTYLISIVNVQKGWSIGREEYSEYVVGRRWLVLYCEIGQRAAEQRHMRWMCSTALDSRSDIAQTLTLAPRYDFFPWVGMGQISIRDLLRLFKVV
jgi:hypothetical protein